MLSCVSLLFPAGRPKEKPRRFERAWCPAVAGVVRRRDGFAARYGLRFVFYTEGSLDSIKNFAVIPCALTYKRINYAETSQMRLRPQLPQDERESARSEGRLAGASERPSTSFRTVQVPSEAEGRLFVGLPAGKNHNVTIKIVPRSFICSQM